MLPYGGHELRANASATMSQRFTTGQSSTVTIPMQPGSGILGLKTAVESIPAMKKQPTQRRCPLQWQLHVAGGR